MSSEIRTPNPEQFAQWMRKQIQDDNLEDPSYEQMIAMGEAFDGKFKGPLARAIEGWQDEVLGRLVRVPQVTGNVLEQVGRTTYQDLGYVLPFDFTDDGQLVIALIIFPGETQDRIHFIVHAGNTSDYATEKDKESQGNLYKFNAHFAPDNDPLLHNGWIPQVGMTPYKSFVKRLSEFGAAVSSPLAEKNHQEAINDALLVARKKKNG